MAEAKVTIDDVASSLIDLGDRLESQWKAIGWPVNASAHTAVSWQAPPISVNDAKSELKQAADRILTMKHRKMTEFESIYAFRLKQRADELAFGSLASDAPGMLRSVLELPASVFRNIPPPAPPPPKVDWEDIKDQRELLPKDLAQRLRHIESRLKGLEPRAATIEDKIADIEAAHQAAEQLPTDLADLAAQRDEIKDLAAEANRLSDSISTAHIRSEDSQHRIEAIESDGKNKIEEALDAANNMIKRSEQALRGTTSAGLAKAFETRSKSLTWTGIFWTTGLAIALIGAIFIGAYRLHELKDILDGSKSASVIWANVLLTLLGIGGPVWFAWLATKQIGASFRLAEDYAFKASVSQAYEGYRAEAVELDPDLRVRLFASALNRIEEAPIRLVDPDIHNSPLSEILNNPAVRKSLEAIPGISEKIIALIPAKSDAAILMAPAAAAAVAVQAVASNDSEAITK